jgi:DNA-nicking Smr family endonuclease
VRRVPIEDSFDLHSFLPRDVPRVLSDYLEEARKRDWREVRIIHGKGKGVRRAEVRRFLAGDPAVEGFFDAPPERGGAGATVVILRP